MGRQVGKRLCPIVAYPTKRPRRPPMRCTGMKIPAGTCSWGGRGGMRVRQGVLCTGMKMNAGTMMLVPRRVRATLPRNISSRPAIG